MITLKLNGYTKEERITLRIALDEAQRTIKCGENCEHCNNRKVCEDFTRAIKYISNV